MSKHPDQRMVARTQKGLCPYGCCTEADRKATKAKAKGRERTAVQREIAAEILAGDHGVTYPDGYPDRFTISEERADYLASLLEPRAELAE